MIKLMNAPPALWEDMPAVELDILLAIDAAVTKGRNNVQERANRG